ncbi:SDR family NAD(P)-dependent oxidoreductase [Sciscionella sediminilitoris]|uniref:SDR family NAD(P)-dependent oxidoreductase n=1 Tax=Sciscionella sediminilitoris TaxID=1445613 RepID=UPI000B1F3CD6|nr:SDR family NAD(P)-dependent oxidoreductase [Sciscionella sp. SE31]
MTGAGSGIGAAIVDRLAEDGGTVVLTDLPPVIDALSPEGFPPNVHVWPLDVADGRGRTQVVERLISEFGRLDVLVNCAGVNRDARIPKIEDEPLRFTLNVNLIGPISLARQAVPAMVAAGRGTIINIASRAFLGIFGSGAYSMSKGGLVGITRALALELGPLGITVNAIAPGFIETPMARELPQHVLDATMAAIPVRHGGRPDDIAGAVSFMVNDGSYVSGQVLTVCGGRSIGNK